MTTIDELLRICQVMQQYPFDASFLRVGTRAYKQLDAKGQRDSSEELYTYRGITKVFGLRVVNELSGGNWQLYGEYGHLICEGVLEGGETPSTW